MLRGLLTMRKPRLILSEADRSRIAQSVAQAERSTSGEIIPVILPSSDSYNHATWICGTIGGFIFTGLAVFGHEWTLHQSWEAQGFLPSLVWVSLFQLLGLGVGFMVSYLPGLRRFMVGREQLRAAVSLKTQSLFLDLGLSQTRDRTGVLIVVSLFERRVEILADQGIHSKVAPGFWDDEVSTIVRSVHEGQFVSGLCQVIEEIGMKLAVSFPRREDDINELPNAPRGDL